MIAVDTGLRQSWGKLPPLKPERPECVECPVMFIDPPARAIVTPSLPTSDRRFICRISGSSWAERLRPAAEDSRDRVSMERTKPAVTIPAQRSNEQTTKLAQTTRSATKVDNCRENVDRPEDGLGGMSRGCDPRRCRDGSTRIPIPCGFAPWMSRSNGKRRVTTGVFRSSSAAETLSTPKYSISEYC